MSIGEQLFVRGMKTEENDSIWDDTQLIKAYDKAMKSYKPIEMAKRIAMATNANSDEKSKPKWRVGSACRAVYEGDGEEYEAFIMEVLDNGECTVRFVGYGDDATVRLSELKASHGTAARSEQVYNITTEPSWKEIIKADFGVEDSALDSASEVETLRRVGKPLAAVAEQSHHRHSDSSKHKKSNKNKKHKRKHQNTSPAGPSLPLPHMLSAIGSLDLPAYASMPPLPPLLPAVESDSEEQDILNNLLTAWYMSGYYAGVYQTCLKKKSKKAS